MKGIGLDSLLMDVSVVSVVPVDLVGLDVLVGKVVLRGSPLAGPRLAKNAMHLRFSGCAVARFEPLPMY